MALARVIENVQIAKGQRGKLSQIHKELNLPYSWLHKLANGKIPNPSARRIEMLAAYFEKDAA